MALFPKPLITAVNGHAIAGGCIGILASDYRIVANNGGRIGLTELLVGVPFPTWALEIARFAIPTQYFQEIIYTGRTYPPQEALSRGLVDEVVPAENLLDRACEVAHQMGAIPPDSFRISKFQIREPLVARCERLAPKDDPGVLAVWSRPDIQQHINEFVARTVKRSS
jgi:enoyl-CoA hydratase